MSIQHDDLITVARSSKCELGTGSVFLSFFEPLFFLPFVCFVFPSRRIAYQESTQTFGVISMRIEVLDPGTNTTRPLHPSASTMAQNITSSGSSSLPGSSAPSSNRATADGITFGDEVEKSSLLIIDQHTFEGNLLKHFY